MKEYNQKPIAKSGNIAVWPAKELINGKKVYPVSFEKPESQRTFVSVFPKIAGHELKPEEILSLSQGIPVTIQSENQYGPTLCTIVNRRIETKIIEQENTSHTNYTMILGAAFHKLDKEGHTWGYNINCNGARISFYADSGDVKTDRNIILTPQDCFKLLDGQTIIKGNLEAHLSKIEHVKNTANEDSGVEDRTYKTARLEIQKIDRQHNFHLRENTESNQVLESIKI